MAYVCLFFGLLTLNAVSKEYEMFKTLEAQILAITDNLESKLRFYESIGDHKNARFIRKEIQREEFRQMLLRPGNLKPAMRYAKDNDLFATEEERRTEIRKAIHVLGIRVNSNESRFDLGSWVLRRVRSALLVSGEFLGQVVMCVVIHDNVPPHELEYNDCVHNCLWSDLGRLMASKGQKFTSAKRQLAEILVNGPSTMEVA